MELQPRLCINLEANRDGLTETTSPNEASLVTEPVAAQIDLALDELATTDVCSSELQDFVTSRVERYKQEVRNKAKREPSKRSVMLVEQQSWALARYAMTNRTLREFI